MKKLLFGLGTVAAVVAPVVSVVACNDDKGSSTETDLRGDWTVKNATELENLFKKLGGNDNAYVNDFPALFTILSNGTDKAELTVYQSNKVTNNWAIVAKGNTAEVADNTGFATTTITTNFDVKLADLQNASYVVIVEDWKVALHEVQQVISTGVIGLSTADTSFSVN